MTADPHERLAEFLSVGDTRQNLPGVKIRDAATMLVIDRTGSTPKVLLGRRHHGHKFMPGKYVFPGGRVERQDRRMPAATPLDPRVEARLMREIRYPSAAKSRGFPLAAIRETFEETGLALGVKDFGAPEAPPAGVWTRFAETGVFPTLDGIDLLARAITPPGRARRFDARFFIADADLIAHRVEDVVHDGAELVELTWTPIEKALELDIPNITRQILSDLAAISAAPPSKFHPRKFYRELRKVRIVEEL